MNKQLFAAIVFAVSSFQASAQLSPSDTGGAKAPSLHKVPGEVRINGQSVPLDSLKFSCANGKCLPSKTMYSPFGFTPDPECIGEACIPPELRKPKKQTIPKFPPLGCNPMVCDPPKGDLVEALKSSGLNIIVKKGQKQELWVNGMKIGVFKDLQLDQTIADGSKHTPVFTISGGTGSSINIIKSDK